MSIDCLKRLRRVFMTTGSAGGTWTCSLELARGLSAFGVEVDLATMGGPLSREQWSETEEIGGLRVFESDFKLEWMDDPWNDVRLAGQWLLKLNRNLKPDVVHLNGYSHAGLDWSAPTLVAAHSCVFSWWRAVKGCDPPVQWNEYRANVTRGLQAAGLVVAPSASMLRSLEAVYGPLPRKKVVPNCRGIERFKPGLKQEYVFSAGRVADEGKNFAALERIAGEILWPIFVAGDTGEPRDAGGARDRQGSDNLNLHLLGRLSGDEIRAWFAQASIYAQPSRYQPFGMSILEAALSGCALVLGDLPALRETWDNAALFVPPSDHHALRDAVNELIIEQPLRKRMAIKARTRALGYRVDRTASAYLSAYKELLHARSRCAAV
jgi:glycosyltransferase involved in cell wall biosynthesis